VARKDPKDLTLLATRKLCTASKRVQSNLVLKLQPESQRKLTDGLRKTEQKNPISTPLRKAKRNPIL
jgi:hypothetical protein